MVTRVDPVTGVGTVTRVTTGNEDSPNCSDPDKSRAERARCATGSRGQEKNVSECVYPRWGGIEEAIGGPDAPSLMGNFVFGEPEDAWKRVAPAWDYLGSDYEK